VSLSPTCGDETGIEAPALRYLRITKPDGWDDLTLPKLELRQEYHDLEGRLWTLDRRLADVLTRIKHASTAADLEQAQHDEQTILTQLDRLMTRMRAIEGQLLQIAKKEKLH
jgi:predicted  nucleic acid-binding Zn-ribbon protein